MSFDPIEDAMERKVEEEHHARAAICRKYAEQYWNETAGGKLPNLALIINDAIGEAIEQYARRSK